MTNFPETLMKLTLADEQRLRDLAIGMAKGLENEDELLSRLGFTRQEYDELAQTRTFREILSQAASEWEGASNTHKRVKLKAAVNVEQALHHFYTSMIDPKEPLSSRVKALEVVARIGQLGNPEIIPPGGGQFFRLEINLGQSAPPIVIEHDVDDVTREHDQAAYSQSRALPVQSKVWDDVERSEL